MANTVWVLGSGFSRALGGPLLTELFTSGSRFRRNSFFTSEQFPLLHDELCKIALAMYENCLPGRRPNIDAWNNPEEFLERLDTAASLGPDSLTWKYTVTNLLRLARSGGIPKEHADLAKLAAATRRLLAAECSAFLVDNDPSSGEKWKPYLKWMKNLKRSDVVLTFNYDLVLETLAASFADKVAFVLPNSAPPSGQRKVTVLKLHGSVDWQRVDDGCYLRSKDPTFALKAADHELAIASPGPSKALAVKAFEDLWLRAEVALKKADAIVFIGYRFPPTDAEARGRLLDAVAKNSNAHLQIRAVLGPNTNSVDSQRLTALLRYAAHHAKPEAVIPESLWAEDFLDRYSPKLFERPKPIVRFV